jgi:hypothetical protein
MVDQYRHDIDREAAGLDAVPHERLPILCCERFASAGHRLYSSFAVLIKLSAGEQPERLLTSKQSIEALARLVR